jgi:lipopolysaccharide export system protein LptA
MRRFSLLIALAVILLSVVVGYTYKLRRDKAIAVRISRPPKVAVGLEAIAPTGWSWKKDDAQANKPIVRVNAKSFQATHDPSTFELHDLRLRLYDKDAASYTYVKSPKALFNEGTGTLKSEAPVTIIRDVPADKDAENKAEADKRVRVETSGVTYETKTGKVTTDQPAFFTFPDGNGKGVGAEYDPNTKILHLKSQVSLNWVGSGPDENKMHVETNDLVYKEAEQKIYLTPSAKLQRQSTAIQAQNAVVTLQDGRLHQIDGDHAVGADDRDLRHTTYSADKMTALFNEDGDLVNIVGDGNAKVASTQPGSQTTLTGNRADLRFVVSNKEVNGETKNSSDLHLVMADGHAIAESDPLPQPGVPLADTRFLRSEHVEMEMKPGGKDIQEIRTLSQSQLEFKPNRPGLPHRVVDASHLRVLYSENSYVDTFLAWNVATHTDKPAPVKDGKTASQPPAPALTWSDELRAKFQANTNQVATVEQTGNFRYQEGLRKASARKAFLDQVANRMTLTETARVLDDTGSTVADKILINQANGDMNAEGRVVSTHAPDKNQRPGTSMLDTTKTMQAKADRMNTRDNNTQIRYEGHAVIWQSANRTAADVIDIDRDAQTLHAVGNVVSELVDNRSDNSSQSALNGPQLKLVSATTAAGPAAPIFTTIYAPELLYRDDQRIAYYTGGVKLIRQKMTITSKELTAYLTPKTADTQNDSSLDHAFANGNVMVFDVIGPSRTRTGTAEHAEYWTKEDKVLLNNGTPQVVDSYKGVTKGQQLTYFNADDRLIVDGQVKKLAFTQMKKK